MTIANGGSFSTLGALTAGDTLNGEGTLVVTGMDSALNAAALTIGNSGFGFATVSAGASIKSQAVTLGNSAGSSGTLIVTGGIFDTRHNKLRSHRRCASARGT